MRILLLAQFLPPVSGGEERHVWNLARALASRSHDVTLLGFATDATSHDVLDVLREAIAEWRAFVEAKGI